MTRITSAQCYQQIKNSGLLSKRRLEVLEAIAKTAPCTASEALVAINTSSLGIGSRFTELRDMGVIYEKGTRKCNITGRNVIEWDLTGNMPVKLVKKKTKPKNLKNCIDYILKGMEIRKWNTIDRQTLINLKKNA